MIVRPADRSDLDSVISLLGSESAGAPTAGQLRKRLAADEYRAEWIWLAQDEASGRPAGAAIWWGTPEDAVPAALDGLVAAGPADPARDAEMGAGLLAAGHHAFAIAGLARPPAYHLSLPVGWRDRPDVVAAVQWREEAARRAGLTAALERIRYEWTAQDSLPGSAEQLRFRAEDDDEVFVGLFRQVLAGSLDATSTGKAEQVGADAQARGDVAFYRDSMLGDRSWWRVASTPDGALAGFGIPSRNSEQPVVGYLGVLPEYRGRGYADEILAEITRVLVSEAAATVIRADTDLANRPMATAFDRAGYTEAGRVLVLSAVPAD
jgi:GNAT superfamily N-acetyltransferase